MKPKTIFSETTYPIYCGEHYAQLSLAELLAEELVGAQVAIITDREVSGYYISEFVRQFECIGIKPMVIIIDGSQAAKSSDSVKAAFERLTDIEFSQKDLLIALGGGGVLDVAGFVAATYRKGIRMISVPTSLLAMLESSIAPSVYLNFQSYKNQIGTDFAPEKVIIDTAYLATLPVRFQANGFAQIIQYGLIKAPDLLEVLATPHLDMPNLVERCLALRQQIAAENPLYLTLGQELGEAIESHFRFLKYTHGEARALGMLAFWPEADLERLYLRFGLPTEVTGVTPDTLRRRVLRNYDNYNGAVSIVKLRSLGHPYLQEISTEDLPALYEQLLAQICS